MKQLVEYTDEQLEAIQQFIADSFGNGEEGLVGHELKSQYVHTDVAVMTTKGGDRCYATFGMGAREMDSPLPNFTRAELVMFASKEMEMTSQESLVIASELQWLSKVPFRNKTWLGPYHTLDASDTFRETFGFDGFVLDLITAMDLEDLGQVLFLVVIPIYRKERQQMMDRSTMDVLEQLEATFDEELYLADSGREKLVF